MKKFEKEGMYKVMAKRISVVRMTTHKRLFLYLKVVNTE
jgi:hypothetical protein